MTLINKERLLENLRERSSLDWDDEGEECGMLLSRIIIDEQPTVEAIPAEWIRKYTEENRLYQSDDFDLYISDMIADWAERKEE